MRNFLNKPKESEKSKPKESLLIDKRDCEREALIFEEDKYEKGGFVNDPSNNISIEEQIPERLPNLLEFSKPRKILKVDSPQPSEFISHVSKISTESSTLHEGKKKIEKNHLQKHGNILKIILKIEIG